MKYCRKQKENYLDIRFLGSRRDYVLSAKYSNRLESSLSKTTKLCSAQKESWDFWSGLCWGNGVHEQEFMCGGLYWVGVDFTATFCIGLTDPTYGKSKITFFQFMFVHSVLLACLVLRNVKRKVTCRKLFASKHRSSLPCGNREKLFIVGIAKLTQG